MPHRSPKKGYGGVSKKTSRKKVVTEPSTVPREDALFARVVDIIEAARGYVARSVNTAMVQAYWLIGREIVEVEQRGEKRAGYGERVVEGLAKRLGARFGRGFSVPNLRNMRQFYLTYREGSALPEDLAGSTKRSAPPSGSASKEIRSAVPSESRGTTAFPPAPRLDPLPNPDADLVANRACVLRDRGRARELVQPRTGATDRVAPLRAAREEPRQEQGPCARAARTADRSAGRRHQGSVRPRVPRLDERSHWRERDLEQAIIDRLEAFLLELGKGFCFVARQRRLTIDGDHFYVDLVFYNRLLRCFVLVDLKLGKLTHQDLGQMQMYVNFFDRFQRAEHEARTIGIVLCSEKNDAMAKITLPENNEQILAARYQLYLPTEEELRAELAREREAAESALRLAAVEEPGDGQG